MAGVVALVIGVVAVRAEEPLPPASSRTGDACRASGPVGLVGLDRVTGDERWTNVVGDDVQNVWTSGPDGDVTSGDSEHVDVIAGDGRVRRVAASTGAVDACSHVSKLAEDEVGRPIPVDAAGAFAREQVVGTVEVVEADGTVRWSRDGRSLVASSTGGVATRTDPEYSEGPPTFDLEVLDPVTGDARWHKDVPGLSAVATPTHLVVVDQFPDGSYPPDPMGSGAAGQQARVTAYDLADGDEAWHVDVAGTPQRSFADAGLILVPGFDGGPRLTAIDDATGKVRWTAALPQPGRGGHDTELGDIDGAAVAGDVVAVAVRSQPPYRD